MRWRSGDAKTGSSSKQVRRWERELSSPVVNPGPGADPEDILAKIDAMKNAGKHIVG
jgi:hypothetical protein